VDTTAETRESAAALVGTGWWAFRRTLDLAVFHFGERIQSRTLKGEMTQVRSLVLHVQCAWRIVRRDIVVVGSGDVVCPGAAAQFRADFDWTRQPTRVDDLMSALLEDGMRQFGVRSVAAGDGSSLRLGFDSDLALEILPDDSLGEEYWRLLRPGTNEPHFVTGRASSTN
jgi:hypothetical protein